MPRKTENTQLSVDDTARLLSKSAEKTITGDMIRKDIDAGAPVNADGTINLVHYAAWLVSEVSTGGQK